MLFAKFINKECSTSLTENIYLSWDRIDTDSIELDSSRFLACAFICKKLIFSKYY